MKDDVDKNDKTEQDIIENQVETNKKKSAFMKLMEYNKPYLFIFTGVLFSFCAGLN